MLLISRTWGSSSPPAEPDFSSDDQDKKDGGTDASEVGAEGKKDGGADEPEQTMSEKDEAMGMAFASIARFADEAPEVDGTEEPLMKKVASPHTCPLLMFVELSSLQDDAFYDSSHLDCRSCDGEKPQRVVRPILPGPANL